ncbi:hypothetical protein [Isoalcanivorax beigongshangi]|uniref:Collagen-like protein n=1 Tax=Isoalcanivorax beigongshangi TaxID=3238810 RepID=A0ABV4AD51_9GAMM
MKPVLSRVAALATLGLALTLSACGGDSSGSRSDGSSATPPATGGGNTTYAALLDSHNPLSEQLCPDVAFEAASGNDIDSGACYRAATATNADNARDLADRIDPLAQFCPVAAKDFKSLVYGHQNGIGVLPLTFVPKCLAEVGGLKDRLGDLLGNGDLNGFAGAFCPVAANSASFNPAQCLTEALAGGAGGGLPTLPGLDNLCANPADPLSCLTGLADTLQQLTGMTDQIPVLGDLLGTLLGGLPGAGGGLPNFGDLCDPTDPLSCLGAVAGLLTPLTALIGEVPVLGEVVNGLLGGVLPGGDNGGGMPSLPGLDGLCDPTDPLSCLSALTGLLEPVTGLIGQVPVLGDIVNGLLNGTLPGGNNGGDLQGLDGLGTLLGLLAPLTDLIGQVPVLGDIVNGLLGGLLPGGNGGGDMPALPGLDCNPTDPLSCLGALTGLLEPVTGLIGQVPVLGDIVNGILGGLLPGGSNGGAMPALPGLDCNPTDPLSCLGALTGLLEPVTGLIGQVPVLGDIVNGILGGLLPGGSNGGDMPALPGLDCNPADPLSCLGALTGLLEPVTGLVGQVPVLGDIVNGLLGGLLPGGNGGGDMPALPGLDCNPTDPLSCLGALTGLLEPVTGLIGHVPVLGDIVNGILGGLLPGGSNGGARPALPGLDCNPAEPLSCLGALTGLLAPVTALMGHGPVLGDIVNVILGGLRPGGSNGGAMPALPGLDCNPADPLSCLGALTGLLEPVTGLVGQVPVLGDIVNGLLGGLLPGGNGGGDMPALPGLDCNPADPLSCLGALTSLLTPLTNGIAQVPVLGDVVNGLLGALLNGGTPSIPGVPNLEQVCGNSNDPLQCLLNAGQGLDGLSGLLGQVPVLGDLLGGLLGGVLGGGGGSTGGNGSPLDGIPILGPILGGLLGGLLG